MPIKPNKVQAAGVAPFIDGGIMTRVQSLTVDTDLGVEEIRELANSNVVEFVEGSPTVSVQLEANMNGSRANLAYLTGQDGTLVQAMIDPSNHVGAAHMANEITHFSYDGTLVDLVVQIEEDNALKRSMYVPDCFVTSLSWNFDVGGVATESYSMESDDKRMYVGTQRELAVVSGYWTGTGNTGTSGIYITPNPEMSGNTYFLKSGFNTAMHPDDGWTPIEASLNGKTVILPTTGAPAAVLPATNGTPSFHEHVFFPPNATAGGTLITAGPNGRWRVLGFKDNISPFISQTTDIDSGAGGNREFTDDIGGIRKGMVEIFLVSGSVWNKTGVADNEEYFRLQTVSVDVDLSRETLEELGNAEAYERSLNFPISTTVNFSALDSDIQAWTSFANIRGLYNSEGVVKVGFRDFLQTAGLLIKVYNDDDSNVSRKQLMTFCVSGLRVASESTSVDAGGNQVQEFSCNADNFIIS